MKFQLDIYTWPAMTGVNPEVRSSQHETPQDAIKCLEAESQPYAYAVLQQAIETELVPCDWGGQLLGTRQEWPRRMGANGTHPAVVALQEDWENLVNLVRTEYDGSRGMIDMAGELLQERHPDVQGYAEKLARAAAE